MKDERLELLSDKVRRGIPIGFIEALEVIEYQESIKKEKVSWRQKIKHHLTRSKYGNNYKVL